MTEPRINPPDAERPPNRVYAPDFLTELFRNPLDAGYADAAARKVDADGAVPLRRTGFVMRMIALVATGLLLVVAYQQTVAAKPESTNLRHNLAGDVAVLVEKIGERDRALRAADRGEHCGKDLIAVQQDLGTIAVDGT